MTKVLVPELYTVVGSSIPHFVLIAAPDKARPSMKAKKKVKMMADKKSFIVKEENRVC